MSDKPEHPPFPPRMVCMVKIDDAMIERATKMVEAISEIEANIAVSDFRPMTLRDLYQDLQAQDDSYLDVPLFLFVQIFRPGSRPFTGDAPR